MRMHSILSSSVTIFSEAPAIGKPNNTTELFMKKVGGFFAVGACLISTVFGADTFVISEFMASNTRTLADEDGIFEDWIEIRNAATNSGNLAGWYLTDRATELTKWQFPPTNVNVG